MAEGQDWTNEVPEEPGPYWFFGWFNGQQRYKNGEPIEPRLDFVNVVRGQNCILYACAVEIQFTGSIKAIGKWRPMVLPDFPDLSEFIASHVKEGNRKD